MMWQREKHRVQIEEAYRDYAPPIDVHKVVSRLLKGIPARHLRRLSAVVLTNADGLSHERRRQKTSSRGRKVLVREARGLYHRSQNGQDPYIELFVDVILGAEQKADLRFLPPVLRRINRLTRKMAFSQDFRFSAVLYHEIGHHIHETEAPQHRERENVADVWALRLMKRYLYRKYWYIFPLVWMAVAGYAMSVNMSRRTG